MKNTTSKNRGDKPLHAEPHIPQSRTDASRTNERVTALLRHSKAIKSRRLEPPLAVAPVFSSEPLIAYRYDPDLARNEKIAVTVKTTLQLHKNDRQEEQIKRANPDVFGREAARSYVYGFVAAFPLSHDRFNWTLAESEWAFSALEPYAIDVTGNRMALAGANYVWLINMETGEVQSCEDPWLSQSHTAQFSEDGKRLLVVSSGFDTVIEFDVESGEVVWQWFAWDHGYDRSKLGHYVVRSREKAKR